jgi:D-serine deaminase-like pyridoxal phosphate-dependent protein
MAKYCADRNLLLAPHAKTTMAPEMFGRLLAAGAWGLSAATFHQVRVLRQFGVRRVLLANELVDPAAIKWVGTELSRDPNFEFWCYVDSVAGVQALDHNIGLGRGGRRLPVLVEVGYPGGRGGVRSSDEAIEVARAGASTGSLRVIGASGFEGTIGSDAKAETFESVHQFVREIVATGEALRAHGVLNSVAGETPGPTELVLSAGGSCFFDIVAAEMTNHSIATQDRLVVLRAGSYVAHDHGLLGRLSPFVRGTAGDGKAVPALELWARVISRPEALLAMVDVGKRDVSYDIGWPIVLTVRRKDCTPAHGRLDVVGMNDQHSYVSLSDPADLEVGDLVSLGVSHACTTFDKWRTILLVNEDYRVLDIVHTFF